MNPKLLHEVKLKEGLLKRFQQFWPLTGEFFKKNQAILKTLALTLIALVFFVGFYYAETWQDLIGFRQRWFGLSIIIVYMLTSFVLAFVSGWDRFRTASFWVQSNLLMLMSAAYFLRSSNRQLEVFDLSLGTGLVFVFMVVLIFLVNYNLFGKNQRRLELILPQVMLFALQGYSFLSLTITYVTTTTSFASDWLNILFNLHPFLWLTISAVAMASVSVLSANPDKKQFWLYFGVYTFLMIQGILVIYLLNFIDVNLRLTYWNLALLAVIYWDYLDTPLRIVTQKLEDTKFYPRLTVSTVYHATLFLLVALYPQIELMFG